MAFIRTILGDIDPGDLGVCYAHEHVIIDPSVATRDEPDFLLDDVDRVVEELRRFHAAGGRGMIDTMPGGAGRNAAKLARVSARSGVHIVCPTGMHLAKYYAPDDRLLSLDETELAAWFIGEIRDGILEGDDTEPRRAGVIKVASGGDRLTPHERLVFTAAARAHLATGCPIITHTEAGAAAEEQVALFADAGVDLSHVTLSHTDRRPDTSFHRALLQTGVRLEYDSCFRWGGRGDNPTLRLLTVLLPDFPNQLMVGMDAARRSYWRSFGGAPGLEFLLTEFAPMLQQAGIGEAAIDAMFVQNPATAYAFA